MPLEGEFAQVVRDTHVYAKDVAVGDALSYFDGVTFKTSLVNSTTVSLKSGLFNPYTYSGSIVVDGVAASCHSSWILDGFACPPVWKLLLDARRGRPHRSPETAAAVYQQLFAVPRAAYAVLGARGMDAVFGVGNAGRTASIGQQTAALAGVLFAISAIAAKAIAAATRGSN